MKNHPARDKNIPGPGIYNPFPKLGEQAAKITMQGRTPNPSK